MTDGLTDLLTDVIASISAIVDENGIQIFRKTALFNNQIVKAGLQNTYDTTAHVNNITDTNDWPACFIEPVIHTVDTNGSGIQTINGTLIIHICTYRLDLDTNWQYPFELRTKVHQAIHLLKSAFDRYVSLQRSMEQADVDHDTLYNWMASYNFRAIDETAYVLRNQLPNAGTSGLARISIRVKRNT